MTPSGADLMYVSNVDLHGFQFTASGVTLTGASSGLSETSFSVNTGNVLGFDFSGSALPAGAGMLAHIDFEESNSVSLLSISNVVLSGQGGASIPSTGPADAEVPSVDCAGVPYGTAFLDCNGTCADGYYLSWVGDGYCDATGYADGAVGYGLNFLCEEFGMDLSLIHI